MMNNFVVIDPDQLPANNPNKWTTIMIELETGRKKD